MNKPKVCNGCRYFHPLYKQKDKTGKPIANSYFCSHFNGKPSIRKKECDFYKGW